VICLGLSVIFLTLASLFGFHSFAAGVLVGFSLPVCVGWLPWLLLWGGCELSLDGGEKVGRVEVADGGGGG